MNFWIGLMCGLFVGAWFGFFIAGLCVAADKKCDPPMAEDEPFKVEK